MKLVGLISDTHGRLPDAALGALAYCNHIIHAGDICDSGILRELQIMAPTTAVLGNNDYDEYGKNVTRFAYPVIDGVRFLVAHYPNDARIGFNGSRAIAPGDPLPQVDVYKRQQQNGWRTGFVERQVRQDGALPQRAAGSIAASRFAPGSFPS